MLRNILEADGFNHLVQGRHGAILFNKNDVAVGQSVQYYGEYFESEVDVFRQIVQPGWHVADVGANIGTHTQALARIVGPSGWVYAFEAQRLVFQTLCANMAINSIANVDCERLVVDAQDGAVLVDDLNPARKLNYGGLSLGRNRRGCPVRSVSLDRYLMGRPLQFMKIDVEGMELACLKGARDTIVRWQTILYLENDRPSDSPALLQYLSEIGYDTYWHLPLFYNADNFAKDDRQIHELSFTEEGGEFFGTIGFAINILCVPRVMNANIRMMRVGGVGEHPLIKDQSKAFSAAYMAFV